MTMKQNDMLNDFEEKEKPWTWHDELTFTAMLIVFSPVIIIAEIIEKLFKQQKEK